MTFPQTAGRPSRAPSIVHQLSRLLDSSLDQLLLKLWPSALLLFFIVVRVPQEALQPAGAGAPERSAERGIAS